MPQAVIESNRDNINIMQKYNMGDVNQTSLEQPLPIVDNLINIPIEMPESSRILKARDNSNTRHHGLEQQDQGTQMKKK